LQHADSADIMKETTRLLSMATVYLDNGQTVEVSQEDLEAYLRDNHEALEPRHRGLRRPRSKVKVELYPEPILPSPKASEG
jgi:chaperonin cofactor prefoldin